MAKGNSFENSINIKVNETLTGVINESYEVYYYRFTVPYKGQCTINVNTMGSQGMGAHLYDKNYNSITYNSTVAGVKFVRIFEADVYFLKVYASGSSTGEYSIHISLDTTRNEEGDTLADATLLEINEEFVGRINYTGDIDYFHFEIPHKALCTVDIKSQIRANAALYDKEGNRITYWDDGMTMYFNRVLEAGEYYVTIRGIRSSTVGDASTMGDYTIKVTHTEEDMEGDSLETATVLSIGEELAGRINYTSDIDYFRFEIPHKAFCTVDIKSQIRSSATLYDKDGNRITYWDDGMTMYFNRLLEAGEYYVSISGIRSSTTGAAGTMGDYTIKVIHTEEDMEGDSRETAKPILIDEENTGRINYAGDVDYFHFKIPHKAACMVAIKSEIRLNVRLFSKEGIEIAKSLDKRDIALEYVVEAGEYYVSIATISSSVLGYVSTGDYTIKVTHTEENTEGDSQETAKPIPVGEEIAGRINYAGDIDYFHFQVPHKALCTVEIKSKIRLNVRLLNKDGIEVAKSLDRMDISLKTIVEAGDYYISIATIGSTVLGYVSTGDYTIKVTHTEADIEGNSIDTATSLKLGEQRIGKINYTGDIDYFHYQVPYKSWCVIEVQGLDSFVMDIYLYDSTGKIINEWKQRTSISVNQLPDPGDYYISVQGYRRSTIGEAASMGSYMVSTAIVTTKDQIGNDFDSAAPLNENINIKQAINYPGDFDFYQFTVSDTAQYLLEISSEDSFLINAYLYNSDRECVNFKNRGSNIVMVSVLEPGIYYLMISGYTNNMELTSVGHYKMSMRFRTDAYDCNSAFLLQDGKKINRDILYPGDIDFFKIETLEQCVCELEVDYNHGMNYVLYDSEKNKRNENGIMKGKIPMILNKGVNYLSISYSDSDITDSYKITYDYKGIHYNGHDTQYPGPCYGYAGIKNIPYYLKDRYGSSGDFLGLKTLSNVVPTTMGELKQGVGNCVPSSVARVIKCFQSKDSMNIPSNIKEIYETVEKIAEEYYGYTDKGGMKAEKIPALMLDSLTSFGYAASTCISKKDFDFNDIKNEIDSGYPLLTYYREGVYKDHAVTIRGYASYKVNGEFRNMLEIIDGWTSYCRYVDYEYFDMFFRTSEEINITRIN